MRVNPNSSEVLEAPDYKSFLRSKIAAHREIRGYHGQLAAAARCQSSYLSQVLNSHVHLTLDQAADLCAHWGFDDDRTEFFLSLVAKDRAGSRELQRHLSQKLSNIRERHRRLSERVKTDNRVISADARSAYYASWQVAAIHVLTSIEEFQSIEKLEQRLNLPRRRLLSTLENLENLGFVERHGDNFRSRMQSVHLDGESPLNIANHFQWRHHAMTKITEGNPADVHYTAVYAMSRDDIEQLRSLVLEFVAQTRAIVAPSKEEEVVGLCLDLFAI